ncbi:hypothetical protein ACFY5J_25425 [Peribacillus butanolivorans]|uniref:hypothetical protein n=1 Tax=Peribacillus butanolivorans TaxID=421767 RepID=UPI003696B2A0
MDDFERMLNELQQSAMEQMKNSNIQIDKDKLNSFKDIISELVSIRYEYASKLPQLQNSKEKEIITLEYSKGGETLHRGYYCPSLILDLTVGNFKRGKLFKRKPDFGKYSYEFGFDTDNRLIRVKGVNEFTTAVSRFDEEYLIYTEDIVFGLEFNNMGHIEVVSKCTYDNGKIVKYERSVCGTQDYEEYFYENNILSEVSIFDVTPRIELYEEQKYKIELDEDSKIVKLIGGFVKNGVAEKDVLDFKK